MSGPRNPSNRGPARPAVDPAGQRDQLHNSEPSVEVLPRPDPITVVEPSRRLTTAPALAPPPDLGADMNPKNRPSPPTGNLRRDDHDLAGEPQDRSNYLVDAHAVCSTLPFLDSSEATKRTACARGPTPGYDS